MFLSSEEAERVLKLYSALMEFVNQELHVIPDWEATKDLSDISPDDRRPLVQAFLKRLELIDTFVDANPADLSQDECEIVSGWRHLVAGRFIALRQLKKHMVILEGDGRDVAYGVVGLFDAIEWVVGAPLPAMIEAVLLPYNGKIVYDGTIGRFQVAFGAGARCNFEESYRVAKASNAVYTSLPPPGVPSQSRLITSKSKSVRASRKSGRPIGKVLAQVIEMTDTFCREHLDDEYAELCRKLARKLADKRPSPLLRGKLETWACGIIRTIGRVNFLDDRSQSPHIKLSVVDRAFGVAESTAQGKATAIRRSLNVGRFDHEWMRRSQWEKSPLVWLLQTSDGRMLDVRKQPPAMQREAFRQGLIPYVPADRETAGVKERIVASAPRRLLQFKITLQGTDPAIWRRIQVEDDTLDKLHEHIQAAMGWHNSHLHEFLIDGRRCGDPELLSEGFELFDGLDSTKIPMSEVVPSDGSPFSFEYHYDFGDEWMHEIRFEGFPSRQSGTDYPQCLEGDRACPPEDIGGTVGFAEYLEAINDPNHECHQPFLDWNGPYDPSGFYSNISTHLMQEGLPDWRKMV